MIIHAIEVECLWCEAVAHEPCVNTINGEPRMTLHMVREASARVETARIDDQDNAEFALSEQDNKP